jgi:hypothetical protein
MLGANQLAGSHVPRSPVLPPDTPGLYGLSLPRWGRSVEGIGSVTRSAAYRMRLRSIFGNKSTDKGIISVLPVSRSPTGAGSFLAVAASAFPRWGRSGFVVEGSHSVVSVAIRVDGMS